MNNKNKIIDSIPEEFSSYEAVADFWDTHDTTDYLDEFETVSMETQLQQRHFEVEIDQDLIPILQRQAQQQGLKINQLVNEIVRKTLNHAI